MKFRRVSDVPKSGTMSTFINILQAEGVDSAVCLAVTVSKWWGLRAGRGGYHLELQTKFANISQ